MITVPQLYWVAGFLEGEGSFQGFHGLRVSAPQVQREPLERLVSYFGGHLSAPRRQGGRINSQPISSWHVTGHTAAALMMTLFCLMSPRRQDQISEALGWWKKQRARLDPRMKVCPNGHDLSAGLIKHKYANRSYWKCPECSSQTAKRHYLKKLRAGRIKDGIRPYRTHKASKSRGAPIKPPSRSEAAPRV